MNLDMVDWDEYGQYSGGVFFPPKLAFRDSDLDLLSDAGSRSSRGFSVSSGNYVSNGEEAGYGGWGGGQDAEEDSGSVSSAGKKRKGSKSETEDEKNKRRAMVAAASRATRAKRKREKEDLKSRNDKLECDREKYLSHIAVLQTEVQTLRDAGRINLTKENDLLRTEIRKHKAFIMNIVSATTSVPDSTDEETYRTVKRGSDSAIGQVVGLTYTSVADPSWISGELEITGESFPLRLQMLPLGCNRMNMKRINIRLDMPDRKEAMLDFKDKIWKTWTDEALAERLMKPLSSRKDIGISMQELPTNFESIEGVDVEKGDMRVFHYKETSVDPKFEKKDCVFVVTWKYSKVFSNFPSLKSKVAGATNVAAIGYETVADDNPEGAIIISSTTTTSGSETFPSIKNKGFHRISAPFIEGHILRRKPDGGTRWTINYSIPIEKKGFAGFSKDDGIFLNEQNQLGESARRTINEFLTVLDEL